jgi:hypothetical protein
MDIGYSYKYFLGNFRHLGTVKNIDMCAVLEHTDKFPAFVKIFDVYREIFPQLVHKCPYEKVSCSQTKADYLITPPTLVN